MGFGIGLLLAIGRRGGHRVANLLVNEDKVSGRGSNGRRVNEDDALMRYLDSLADGNGNGAGSVGGAL